MEGLEDVVPDMIPVPEMERRGGPQGEDDDDAEQRKAEERERKKKEVRDRLDAERQGKKAKKGFLTPERKKRLRKVLTAKAAEELKAQQLAKEKERKEALEKRTMKLPNIDAIDNQTELEKIAKQFHDRICQLEGEKYEIAVQVSTKDFEIKEQTIAVCGLKGKYVKPQLNKVSKYDNKFKKLKKAEGEADYSGFRQNLKKSEKKDVFADLNEKQKEEPEWKRKKREDAEMEAATAHQAPRPPKPETPTEEGAPAEAPAEEAAAPEEASVAEE